MSQTLMIKSYLDIPIGHLRIIVSEKGIKNIHIIKQGQLETNELADIDSQTVEPHQTDLLEKTKKQLSEYFAGMRKQFDLPLDIQGTEFQKQVWLLLMDIPYGQTASYQQIAELAGNPKAVRAVGMANNKNRIPLIIPCHRVIGKNGDLVGYAGGLDIKKWLLDHEKQNS